MARMLTEDEVKRIEEQRALRDRARAAGSTAGMDWNERKRFEEAQERQMWDKRFRETHGGLSRAEVAAAGPDGSGRQYAAIKRGFELQAQREFEQKRLGEELGTRRFEAKQKRLGMREQGRDAAEFNKEAAIRAAELQTAGAAQVASINRDRDMGVAKINAESNERINKDKGDVAIDVARIGAEGATETAGVQARAQAAQQYAQNLMKQRQVDEESAWNFAKKRADMIAELRAKQKHLSEDAAARLVDERLKGGLPGKARVEDRFRR